VSLMTMSYHIPVLIDEVIDGLKVKAGGSYIDCTVGEGGHSKAILEASAPNGQLLGIDLDPQALETAGIGLQSSRDRVVLANDNFGNLGKIARNNEFYSVDGILLDLGLSSLQLEAGSRGFSFRADEPLDMRFGPSLEISAWEVVNRYSQDDLAWIIKIYGEEYRADRIAKEVIENRPIDTSLQLAQVVMKAIRGPWGRTHPATRTFQAIRIHVNGEMENLEHVLSQAISLLESGGRFAVISYHSLEDRLVKNFFRQESKEVKSILLINKKIIVPSRTEVRSNHRSRSARMRVAERI
jgi:16S rRNA (cytosine1402-N4)-methyltransferase